MKTIGILGGMGPEATNRLCSLITKFTPANKDQDHLTVICYNNPKIPNRLNAIFANGESPVPEMLKTANALKTLGADFIIMPCNTAHHYIKDIQALVQVPFINYMQETVNYIKNNFPKIKRVGILGTSLTYKSKLYETPLKKDDFTVFLPDDSLQRNITNAIYQIKAGNKQYAKNVLIYSANILHQKGAQVIIAGCTEIPLVINQTELEIPMIDPSIIVAKKSIELATSSKKSNNFKKPNFLPQNYTFQS